MHSPALHQVSSPGYLPGSPRQPGTTSSSATETTLVAPSNGLHKYQFEYGDIEPLSSIQDLGRPDVYERASNEDEDNMSEYNVRHGFIDKAVLQNELYSAHELIYDRLSNTGIIYGLEQFMINVLKRRHDSTHLTGGSTYKPPNRVTLNDQKRDAWMADLAGEATRATPATPMPKLSKLARTVPHGLRGEKLLDAIASRIVPVQRACWLIRSVGYGEFVQNSRTKTNYTQQQYTLEWTSIFNAWIRKRITSAASITQASPAANAQANGKKPATKENEEQRASSALGYAFRLARYLYVEGLLDQRSWLKSCIDTFSKVEISLCGLSLPLIEMYSGEFQRSRALLKMLLEACQHRLEEFQKVQDDIDQTVHTRIRTILTSILLSVPDAFVHPSLWGRIEPTLNQAMGQMKDLPHDQLSFMSSLQLEKLTLTVAERLQEIHSRNEAFLAQEATPRTQSQNVKLQRAEMLDGISPLTDYSALAKRLFDGNPEEAITSLAEWATTRMKYGEWRIYAAVSLLKQFCHTASMKVVVQSSLLSFLNDTSIEYNNSISRLFGELIAAGLFSYGKYLQRLIARGDLQPSRKGDEVTQRHLYFLQMFPLSGCSKEQMNQRRVVVSDSTIVDAAVMEKNINSVVDKIKARLPGMFPSFDVAETSNFDAATADYMSTSLHRDGQLRITREWLVPSVKNHIVQHVSIGEDNWRVMTMPGSSLLDVPQFCFVIRSLELLYDLRSVLDLCLWMLDRTHERDLLECAVLTMLRHVQTFGAMMENDNMLSILTAKHASMRQKGSSFRNMMRLILRLSNDATLRMQMETELNSIPPSMASQLSNPPPAYFPEVRSLQDDSDPNAPKTLASTLHFRYASFPNWISLVIENSMMTVLDIADATTDKALLRSIAQRHTQLLLEIGERDPNDFTMAMSEWMTGKVTNAGTNGENSIFNRKGISTAILLIIGLCQRGTFAVALVIERLALPMMTAASAVDHKQNDSLMQVSTGVISLILLLRALLISGQNTGVVDDLELTLEEMLHLETQRTMLGPASADIATILHHLHILHGYLLFNDPLSHAVHRFERDLADAPWFKAAAMQNMEVLYPKLTSGDTQSSKKGMEFLKTMLESANSLHMASSAADQFRELVSRACEWNFRETQIAFRLVLDRAAIPEDEMDDSMPSQSPESVIASIVEQFFVGLVFNDKLDQRQLCDLLTGMKSTTSNMFYRYGESLLFNGPQAFLASMTVKHTDISRAAFMKHWQTYLAVMAKLKIQDHSLIKNAFLHIVTFEEESKVFKKMITTYGQAKGEETGDDWENMSIDEIRTCLLVRLRLVQMSYPAEVDEAWVMTLLRLSCTPLVHKDGLNDDLFTIVLDIISVMIDALSKPSRQNIMLFLRTLNLDDFPRNLLPRLARILPYEVRNMYTRGLKLKNGAAVPLRPWDWLEDAGKAGDCTGANEAPISLGVFGAKRIKYEESL